MRTPRYNASRPGAQGFTLLEILLATAIFAIVLVAINTVFFAGLRLRSRTVETIETALPLNRALAMLKSDLQNAVPPGGLMAGYFRGGMGSTRAVSREATGTASAVTSANLTVAGSAEGSLLDFFTTTAQLNEYEPWSEIQQISYQLTEPADGTNVLGRDLVRVYNRNLLTLASAVPVPERLLANVEYLEFEFFDGTQWHPAWDTTSTETGLPSAVRVRLLPAVERSFDTAQREPLEMVVLIPVQGSTATNTTAEVSP